MSANNAPPNPGQPRGNPMAPKPSMLARYGSKILAGGVLAGVALFYLVRPPAPRTEPVVNFRTPGVKNIERAYTNAGATPTHTKAYGGTTQGDKESIHLRDGGGTGAPDHKESPFEGDGMGDEQRPRPTTKVGEVFDHTNYGSEKGEPLLTYCFIALTGVKANEVIQRQ